MRPRTRPRGNEPDAITSSWSPGRDGTKGTVPIYAEDLIPGSSIALGSYLTDPDEMITFAEKWDPQPFHTDVEFAQSSHFGEIIASGLYTLALFQRLAVLGAFRDWAVVAGRRIRSVDLTAPVLPGMTLHASITVDSVEATRPDRSLVILRGRVLSDDDLSVLEAIYEIYVRRRHGDEAPTGAPAAAGERDR
jgi:acyl dehydratase